MVARACIRQRRAASHRMRVESASAEHVVLLANASCPAIRISLLRLLLSGWTPAASQSGADKEHGTLGSPQCVSGADSSGSCLSQRPAITRFTSLGPKRALRCGALVVKRALQMQLARRGAQKGAVKRHGACMAAAVRLDRFRHARPLQREQERPAVEARDTADARRGVACRRLQGHRSRLAPGVCVGCRSCETTNSGHSPRQGSRTLGMPGWAREHMSMSAGV